MADEITMEKYMGFGNMFRRFDSNGNGFVSSSEWISALSYLGEGKLDSDEIAKEIKEVDTDLDGRLNFPEFVHRMCRQMRKMVVEEQCTTALRMIFREFDQNDSGFMSFKELRAMLRIYGKTDLEANKILEEFNGVAVGLAEFEKIMKYTYEHDGQ